MIGHLKVGDLRDGAAHGMHGIGVAECPEAVSTFAFEGEAITVAANGDSGNAQAASID